MEFKRNRIFCDSFFFPFYLVSEFFASFLLRSFLPAKTPPTANTPIKSIFNTVEISVEKNAILSCLPCYHFLFSLIYAYYSIYKKNFQTFLAFSHTISTFCICLAVPTPPYQKISAHSVRSAWLFSIEICPDHIRVILVQNSPAYHDFAVRFFLS